jgi:YbbR domain-containing protein
LEIEPTFLGEPAFGYRLDTANVQIDPRSVLAEGPKSQLEKLAKVKTQPIDLVGRIRSFRKTVRVAEEPGLEVLSESLVDVYVPIQEAVAEKTFEKIPVKILGEALPAGRVFVEPAKLTLVLRGAAKDLEALTPERILVYVEITGLAEGNHSVSIQTTLPPNIFLKENPPPARVTIQAKGS